MTFCSVCGENIGNANFCPNCGTAPDPSPPQTKNSSEPITYQTQTPSQQGMQRRMYNTSPMMIIGIIAMIIMMIFMFIFIFPNVSNFWNR
ncbi:MAG: hypothetical protein ACW981_17560 [Candidatus Hodarchaeales archaeon]